MAVSESMSTNMRENTASRESQETNGINESTSTKMVSKIKVGRAENNGKSLNEETKECNKGIKKPSIVVAKKVRIIENEEIKKKYKIVDNQSIDKGTGLKENGKGKESENINRKNDLESVKIREIRMVAFSRAEVTMYNKMEAHKVIEYSRRKDAGYVASIPRRKMSRRGVTKEWEGSIEELMECTMAGQGEFEAQRLKKRKLRDGKAVWEESDSILLKFKGEYHGECRGEPKCVNCGQQHRSNARECLIFQRESETKKIMAYKNVSYAQAREILRDKYTGRKYDIDIESETDFPRLKTNSRGRRENWERLEIPNNDDKYNEWKTKRGPFRNRERETSDDSDNGRMTQRREQLGSFRYTDRFQEREMKTAARQDRVRIMNRVPLARERPWVKDPPGINVYEEYDNNEETRKKKLTGRIRGENYKLLDEIKSKSDDKILEQIIQLISERNLLNNFERKIKETIKRKEKEVPVDPEEDWWGCGPHFHTVIPEKMEKRFARQRERKEEIEKLHQRKESPAKDAEGKVATENDKQTKIPSNQTEEGKMVDEVELEEIEIEPEPVATTSKKSTETRKDEENEQSMEDKD
ncbi:trichohyalin-like [Osmia bicornis bicornis]|uniref:trichohyalin-like n=1 Tax=Osmia bicornis bicornis TaxID=1437191 RepID=UPI001EAEAAAF|nr:trichohyalin-like [Osmia bicornis bicornis]